VVRLRTAAPADRRCHRRTVQVSDVLAKALVLVPAAVLLAAVLDLGGLQVPVERAVVGSAEAVAQPVADELLERLPWPGPRATSGRACVFGPYAAGDPCAPRGQAPT
jgi:hypothetical protein